MTSHLRWALLFAAVALRGQQVALTFDDLPRTGELPPNQTRVGIVQEIVKILVDAKAPRVYGFVNGGKLRDAPEEIEALKAWTAAGFPLANHGYSHLNLAETPQRRYTRDIVRNEPLLRSLMPKPSDWHWYRYPYLEEGATLRTKRAVAGFLGSRGYRVAEVSMDFEDFLWNAPYARCLASNDSSAIEWLKSSYLSTAGERVDYARSMSNALYGRDIKYIMLLHVGGFEPVMLPELMKLVAQRQFSLTTLEDAESDPAYRKDPEWPTKHGGDFLTLTMHRRGLALPQHEPLPRERLDSVCR